MLTAQDLMQAKPQTVSPDMTLVNLEQLFLSTSYAGFPVVADERLVGVISRSDIVRSMVTERSRAEQLSDFYCGANLPNSANAEESLETIAVQVGVRFAELSVGDAMSRNIVSAEASDSLESLAKLMVDGHLHRVPVIKDGRLVGIVTSMDLVDAIARGRLAEVRGFEETGRLIE